MSSFIRASGVCLIAAGVLIAGNVFHPNIFEISFAEATLATPYWTAWHAGWLIATILSLFGLAGLAAAYGARMGVLGAIGLVVAVPGLVLWACTMYVEAFLFPPMARADPALLDLDGPVFGPATFRVVGGLVGLWLLGLLLIGIALWRSRVVPPAPAILLAVGAAGFGVFEGPFIPVLGVASVVIFAAAHVWLGYVLWSAGIGRGGLASREEGIGATL